MSKQTKVGLEYFPLVCDFFYDYKIKRLKRTFGALGITTYINLLCKVYANGYYLKYDNLDDLAYTVAEEIVSENDRLAKVFAAVRECISHMAKSGLIDENLFANGIITSEAIQTRYKLVCEKLKRKAQITEWNLLTGSTFVVEEKQINTEFKPLNTEFKAINTEFMPQREIEREIENKRECIEKFTPPTLAQITAYCKARKNDINPQRFLDYYTARGWMVSGRVMADWKAAVRAWETRDTPHKTRADNSAVFLNEAFKELNEDI